MSTGRSSRGWRASLRCSSSSFVKALTAEQFRCRRTHRSAAGASNASPGPLKRIVGRLPRRRKLRNPKLLSALLSVPEVVLRLLVEPTLGGRTKGNGKTDRHLGADPGTAIQNGGQGLAKCRGLHRCSYCPPSCCPMKVFIKPSAPSRFAPAMLTKLWGAPGSSPSWILPPAARYEAANRS